MRTNSLRVGEKSENRIERVIPLECKIATQAAQRVFGVIGFFAPFVRNTDCCRQWVRRNVAGDAPLCSVAIYLVVFYLHLDLLGAYCGLDFLMRGK